MFNIDAIPNRDRLLENVYTSTPLPLTTVVDSGILPTVSVSTEVTLIPDLTEPAFEIDGKWVYGSDIKTFYHKAGGQTYLTATWWAIKDEYSPEQIQQNVSPEIVAASQNLVLAGLKRIITLSKERTLKTLLTTSGNYASGFTYSPSTKWDASSGTTIIKDINDGMDALANKGLSVDAMILPFKVYRALRFAPELRNVYTGREKIDINWLQDFFEIPRIVIPNVFTQQTVKKNPVLTSLWGDDVVLLHLDNIGAGTYPSIIVAQLDNVIIQNLPLDPEKLTSEIIARECKGYNFLKNDAAYLLDNVLST